MARRGYTPPQEPEGGGGAWLATYADAITLLMAFFVMLYAMSQVDATKFELFLSGLADPFGNTTVSAGLLSEGSSIVGPAGAQTMQQPPQDIRPPSVQVVEVIPQPTPEPPRPEDEDQPAPSVPPFPPAGGELDDAEGGPAPDRQLEEVAASVSAALVTAGLRDVAELDLGERGLVVTIATDDVLFESGSTQLGPVGRELVAAVAAALRGYANQVLVEGHTDDVPLQRPGYTNWNLSTDRAVAVLSELVDAHGLPPVRLAAAGYGEHRPRVPNDSAAQRSLNRRVDVLVLSLAATERTPRPTDTGTGTTP